MAALKARPLPMMMYSSIPWSFLPATRRGRPNNPRPDLHSARRGIPPCGSRRMNSPVLDGLSRVSRVACTVPTWQWPRLDSQRPACDSSRNGTRWLGPWILAHQPTHPGLDAPYLVHLTSPVPPSASPSALAPRAVALPCSSCTTSGRSRTSRIDTASADSKDR